MVSLFTIALSGSINQDGSAIAINLNFYPNALSVGLSLRFHLSGSLVSAIAVG